ncbi:hypothetical protein GCM10012275_19850 [Longimycelium tulufanense]|uniref:Lantibiotic dehydratase N-terminal domain-containing protein n=2 Tax=Longimycelium tulufanense TaxID=907463 RepID=A0A8J3C7F1_9PSEU|nr:hypothetical protein GCM10012275_19850 [Longimycelium tulufanense]
MTTTASAPSRDTTTRHLASSVAIVRCCGLPVRALDSLAASQTLRHVRSALDHLHTAQQLAADASQDLHDRLRRDLDDAAGLRLQRWSDAMQDYQDHLGEARRVAETELRSAARTMLDRLRQPRIALGLALASPTFTTLLLDHDPGQPLRWGTRLAHTAAGYLARIARKTSPFSSLTTLGVAALPASSDASVPPPYGADRTVSSARPAAMELLRVWAEHSDGPTTLLVRRNPSLRAKGNRLRGVVGRYGFAHTEFFREDELIDCSLAKWVLQVLPADPFPLSRAVDLGLSWRSARRLLSEGLVLPVTPWALADETHFPAFRDHASSDQGASNDSPSTVKDTVEALADLEAGIGGATDPRRRAADVELFRATLARGFRALGHRPPDWLTGVPLFDEVVAHGADRTPQLPTSVHAELRNVSTELTSKTRRRALYDRLVDHFVALHGRGGRAPDLLDFCYSFLENTDPQAMRREFSRPATSVPSVEALRGHRTVGPAASTVSFQIAAETPDSLQQGKYLLVLNDIRDGLVGPMARWAAVPALHDHLATSIERWLADQHPGCRVYQVSAQADWVTVQRPTLRSLPRAAWGPGLCDAATDTVDLRHFSLIHDPHSGTLQVHDSTGSAAFAYTGSVAPHLLGGIDQLLCLLSAPWMTLPARWSADLAPPRGEMTYQPRVQRGRVVWRRARWELCRGLVPQPGTRPDPVGFLAEAEQWRRDHGLPREFFLEEVCPAADRTITPQWVSIDHPHVLHSALRQIDPAAPHVEIVEALPARHEYWFCDANGDALATEFTVLLRHGEEHLR